MKDKKNIADSNTVIRNYKVLTKYQDELIIITMVKYLPTGRSTEVSHLTAWECGFCVHGGLLYSLTTDSILYLFPMVIRMNFILKFLIATSNNNKYLIMINKIHHMTLAMFFTVDNSAAPGWVANMKWNGTYPNQLLGKWNGPVLF